MTTQADPVERQAEIEAEMIGLGMKRYTNNIQKAKEEQREDGTDYGRLLMAKALDPLSAAIREFLDEAQSGKPGRRHTAAAYLTRLEPEVAAFLTTQAALSSVSSRASAQKVATRLGFAIEDHVHFTQFAGGAPGLWKVILKNCKSSHRRHRRNVLRHAANKFGDDWEPWPERDRLLLGLKLLELFAEVTGYIHMTIEKVKSGRAGSRLIIRGAPKVVEWIEARNSQCEALAPYYMPCVIPPRPWTGSYDGGYHSGVVRSLTLVKTRNHNYLEELNNCREDMEVVYESINAMQDTAWKVNRQILAVANEAWDRGLSIGKLPPREDLRVPDCPLPEDRKSSELDDEEKRKFMAWKATATEYHATNAKFLSKRLLCTKTLWLANKFKDEPAIYMPYQLDFRGRVYAMPYFLNPQGDDLGKALLTFAEAKEIGTGSGAGWLAIHGANLFGYDKVSLEDRIGWVEEHNDRISAIAQDPFSDYWWTEADKPWQFLAFCFEWAGFLAEGYSFKSSLPVALDGSCNGLQNFSAALRDHVGGKAVNLVPAPVPEDIYQRVADLTTEKLRQKNDPMAHRWLSFCGDQIPRAAAKRPVMVLPYGGTLTSCREYLEDFVKEQTPAGQETFFGSNLFEATQYLAPILWEAIGEIVVAARACMDWLRKVAREITKNDIPIQWTTPTGLPVLQSYKKLKARRIEVQWGEGIRKLTLSVEQPQMDPRRQVNGISPNWVHSLDAAHLQLSVALAVDNGITAFSMVHDSYGTHAANTDLFAACLREAFVGMYEANDVVAQFAEEAQLQLSTDQEMPSLPHRGELDLSGVLESDFFFA